jgi:hypothetical protein
LVARRLLPNMRGWPRMSAAVLAEDMALGCLSQHKKDVENFSAVCKLKGAVARAPTPKIAPYKNPLGLHPAAQSFGYS